MTSPPGAGVVAAGQAGQVARHAGERRSAPRPESSALTCVRVLSTTCSPSLRCLREIATARSCHAAARQGSLTQGSLGRTWTTSPAPRRSSPLAVRTTSRPPSSTSDRPPSTSPSGHGHLDLLARRRHSSRYAGRRSRAGSPRVVAAPELLDQGRQQRRAVDRSAGDERQRGRLGHGQLVGGLGAVDADADHGGGRPVVLDPLEQDPAQLVAAGEHVVGPLQADLDARDPAYGGRGRDAGQQRQPRPPLRAGRPRGRAGTRRSASCAAGVTHSRPSRPRPAVWCSATSTSPSPSPARNRSATPALVEVVSSTTSTRQRGRS